MGEPVMSETGSLLLQTALVGIGATVFMDLWAWIQRRAFDIPSLDYRLVGRWAGHLRQGQFRHAAIAKAPPIRHERAAGWALHYLIGMGLAGLLVWIAGPGWLREPSLGPALLMGLVSVLLPFGILQPAFGLGIAGRNSPHPGILRRRSLIAHLSFGLGLYLAAEITARLI